jgi:hypothetical protein
MVIPSNEVVVVVVVVAAQIVVPWTVQWLMQMQTVKSVFYWEEQWVSFEFSMLHHFQENYCQ